MADTTLNVRVVNNGTGGAGGTTPPVTPPNTPPSPQPPQQPIPPTNDRGNGLLPSNDRMIEDVRREMQQRGVLMVPGSSSMSQIINQVVDNNRKSAQQSIKDEFTNKRKSLYAQRDEDIQLVEEEKRKFIKSKGLNPDDESDYEYARGYKRVADYEVKQRHIFHDYSERLDEVNKEEKSKRADVDERLTNAIEELTKYFERQSGNGEENPNSYIGQLRAQQRALIQERDAATTLEGAQDASRRLAGVNEQLRDVMAGGLQGRPVYDSMLQGTQGIGNILNGLEQGDPSGIIMGLGGAYAGFSGMGLKAALRFMGIVGLIAGGVGMGKRSLDKGSEILSSASELGAMGGDRSGLLPGLDMKQVVKDAQDETYIGAGGMVSAHDYGLLPTDIVDRGTRYVRQRGDVNHWKYHTYMQIGMERSLGMESGALERGSMYDRYGLETTEALSRLVLQLDKLDVQGIKVQGIDDRTKDFSRVQEVFDIQQQIMGSWMRMTDKPNYDAANKLISAFSSIKGITQDSRIGDDILTYQNAISNPMNDSVRAILYDVVQRTVPKYDNQSTAGRADLTMRILNDPKYSGRVIQEYVRTLAAMHGGPETQMGFLAFHSAFPNIALDRLIPEINDILNGKAASILKGDKKFEEENFPSTTTAHVKAQQWAGHGADYTTWWEQDMKAIKETLQQIQSWLVN